ncbi:carboxypeptidase-like regulatory domain-containing protein [Aquimarina pacifica]|uniref:carboxypeptidase-like regulatory domain-containing protein n=1 Tax=Aquimarina pacifica TaxID=1296415 RepID=UPI00047085B1|nr:carboxypeptidase-like regulatory domain-containing protein [Aquimarina pacifica]
MKLKKTDCLPLQLVLLLCLFTPLLIIAQEKESTSKQAPITIVAKVLDKESKEPLPFTNVIVEGTSIGTITNEEGFFELTVSEKYKRSKLVFSFIGYQNTSIAIKSFDGNDKFVYLETESNSLDEVLLIAKNKYKEFINQAIATTSQNYAQQATLLETYYRELTKIDNKYTKFADAAINLYYSPYDGSFDLQRSRVGYYRFSRLENEIKKVPFPEPSDLIADYKDQAKIIALRKSDNLQKYKILKQSKELSAIDTTNLKWLENNEIGGGPLRLTGADKFKRQEDFFDPKTNGQYLFKLYGRSSYNNKPVYIISFAPKDSTNAKAKYKGEITLDEESKAVIAYQYSLTKLSKKQSSQKFGAQLKTPESVEKESKLAFISRTTSLEDYKIYVTYSYYNGKWYLKRIKATNTYLNTGDLFEDYTAITESELVINKTQTENIQVFPINEVFDSIFSNALFNLNLPYNQPFWKSYSTLVATGVVGKALEDLESTSSLEKQFETNK